MTESANECASVEPLWCVHVYGPDDVFPMPNREAAWAEANKLNYAMMQKRRNDGNDPFILAIAEGWPHSRESHADVLKVLN